MWKYENVPALQRGHVKKCEVTKPFGFYSLTDLFIYYLIGTKKGKTRKPCPYLKLITYYLKLLNTG